MLHIAGKAKASALAAHANETLPANADVDVKDEAPSASATQPPSDQEHQVNAQPNSESLSRDTAQPAAAPQVVIHKSPNGVSTLQSSPSDPRDPDDSPSVASDNMMASRSQSPVPHVSQPPITQQAQQALRSPVPSSLASSPMQSPRPRSAASEADSMPDGSSVHAPSAPCSQSSHALSASLHSRLPHSPAHQQGFSQQLRSALSSAGSQSHHDSPLQKQATTQKPPATPRGHKAEQQPSGAISLPPSRPDSPIVPQHSAAVQSASPRRPSFATEPASVMVDMTNAMPRGVPTSPGPRSGIASPRQAIPEQGTHGHTASSSQPADRQAAASAALAAAAAVTGPPKANAEAAHLPQAQPASTQAPAHHSSEQSSRCASPFERAAAALFPLAAVSPAGNSKGVSTSDSSRPVSADAASPDRPPQDEAAVPTSPPVTTPVRKPPGLPSPVPAAQDPGSADLDSVISSDRWGDQISAKSETSSNPRSPKKGIKVPAVVAPAPPPPALAPPVSVAPSEIMSDVVSEDGSSFEEDKQSVSSSQLDHSAAAVAARLAKEREQQLKQEAKHLAGKERAAAKRRQEIAEQDRRQQEEHARRAQAKAAAAAEKAALNNPGLHPSAARPFAAPHPAGVREPYRGLKGLDEAAAKQAPKQYPAAGVKHVPAHPAPHQVRLPGSDWSDFGGSDYGSDYGDHDPIPQGRGQGRGRGPAMERGGRAAGRGPGRGGGRGPVPGTFSISVPERFCFCA